MILWFGLTLLGGNYMSNHKAILAYLIAVLPEAQVDWSVYDIYLLKGAVVMYREGELTIIHKGNRYGYCTELGEEEWSLIEVADKLAEVLHTEVSYVVKTDKGYLGFDLDGYETVVPLELAYYYNVEEDAQYDADKFNEEYAMYSHIKAEVFLYTDDLK